MTHPPITVLIPAYREADRIAATVTAARALPGVTRVLVIDDGSPDDTAERAEAAGAETLRLARNGGKGAALRAGLAACPGAGDDLFLLLDADLGDSAAEAAALLGPIVAGEANLTIARFPTPPGKAGFGLVKGLARTGTRLLTGQTLTAPISGQRACRRWVLAAAPIADGYGVEVAMNVAAGDAGARIVEMPVAMTHAHTGRTLSGFRHRGRQFVHIFEALLAASLGKTGEPLVERVNPGRAMLWLAAVGWTGWIALMWSAFWADDVAGIVSLPNGFKWHLLWLLPLQLLAGLLLAWGLAIGLRARRANYRKRLIPALGGLCLLVPCIFLAVLAGIQAQVSPNIDSPAVALIGCLLGWMLLGLVDDLAGTAENKGFRGHLRALLHGKLTTGGIKLLGGGLLALGMAGLSIHTGPRLLTIPLAALVIALSANALNLFDLRPGRALKVWWLGAIPLILWPACATDLPWSPAGLYPSYWALAGTLLLLTTLLYAPLDFGAMMMLGDTGSNPLGALLGLLIVVSTPWPGQLVVLALLIALHVYAERASITWLIARVPVLTWLDRLGRGDT